MVPHEDIFVLDILENQQDISQLCLNFITGQTLKKIAIRGFPLKDSIFIVKDAFLPSIAVFF